MMKKVDKNIVLEASKWSFDGNVNEYFDDHVKKSVPLYEEAHQLIGDFSDHFISNGSVIYDLGCSTGTLLKKLSMKHESVPNLTFIGLDISKNMIQHSKKNCELKNVKFFYEDISKAALKPSSIVLSIYTMQFIRPKERQEIINNIYNSLEWGGAFFLFEKVRGSDARFQDIMQNAYTDFKLNNNFNSDEIINKTRSLKGVMEPFSREGNLGLLKRAGFEDVESIFRYNCFEGYLAIK